MNTTDPTRNASGCKDMTAYKGIKQAAKDAQNAVYKRKPPPKVFICSPFAGDTEANVAAALRYCRFALERGKLPIAPHCYFPRFMDDSVPDERELAMSFGLRLLYECRELWAFGSHVTDGMKVEMTEARCRGIHIRRFDENMQEMK
jgi:hypothetical protein